jgi:hypothetical protein
VDRPAGHLPRDRRQDLPARHPDPLLSDLQAWFTNEAASVPIGSDAAYSIITLSPTVANVGTAALRVVGPTNTQKYLFSRTLPIDPGKTYRVSLWTRRTTTDANSMTTYPLVNFRGANGASVVAQYSSAAGWVGKGTYFYFGTGGGQAPTAWTKHEITFGPAGKGTAQIPDDPATLLPCRFVQIGCLVVLPEGANTAATTVQVQDVRLEIAAGRTLIENGAVTTDVLAANAVRAANIEAGTITSREIAAGSITADRMTVGGFQYVDDPGFEASSYANNTTNWQRNSTSMVAIVNAGVNGGVVSARLGQGGVLASNAIRCTPGDVFQVSVTRWTSSPFSASGGNAAYPLYIFGYNALGAPLADYYPDPITTTSASAATVVYNYTVPAGVFSFKIGAAVSASVTGYLYVDGYRVVNVTTNALIVNGAISADKLAASVVLGDVITTREIASAGGTATRVVLDNTSVPLWVGAGTKSRANARLQFDTAGSGELLVQNAKLALARLAPDVDGLLVETAGGYTAKIAAMPSLGYNPSYTSPGTVLATGSYWRPLGFRSIWSPWAGAGTPQSRLASMDQIFYIGSTDFGLRLSYSYDGASELLGNASGLALYYRAQTLGQHFLDSGWKPVMAYPGFDFNKLDLRPAMVKVSGGGAVDCSAYGKSIGLDIFIPNLGTNAADGATSIPYA